MKDKRAHCLEHADNVGGRISYCGRLWLPNAGTGYAFGGLCRASYLSYCPGPNLIAGTDEVYRAGVATNESRFSREVKK